MKPLFSIKSAKNRLRNPRLVASHRVGFYFTRGGYCKRSEERGRDKDDQVLVDV
jgi:hypothetical protein